MQERSHKYWHARHFSVYIGWSVIHAIKTIMQFLSLKQGDFSYLIFPNLQHLGRYRVDANVRRTFFDFSPHKINMCLTFEFCSFRPTFCALGMTQLKIMIAIAVSHDSVKNVYFKIEQY